MRVHEKFIKSSIINILNQAMQSVSACGNGMETYPLCEYIMQSTFLQMTGFNEQKLKCILGELATDDFEFRHDFLRNNYNECSSYRDKQQIFKDLINEINKNNCNFSVNGIRSDLFDSVKNECKSVFESSVMNIWLPRQYENYIQFLGTVATNQFLQGKTLLSNCLLSAYEKLYRHRNRCAHNLLSYQDNLPTLTALNSEDYKYDNWFIRFFLLILIDEVFTRLYKIYLDSNHYF